MKKTLLFLFTAFLFFGFSVTSVAETGDTGVTDKNHPPYVVDNADLLNPSEEAQLSELLSEISERQQFTVAVVTTASTNGQTPAAFTDDYYDYNGYGYGTSYDGAMLMLSMQERDWYISTFGYGVTALTDAGIDYIGEEIVSYFSSGDYFSGFSSFGRNCDDFVTKARNDGVAYDVGNMPSSGDTSIGSIALSKIPISLVIGVGISLIICLVMKSSLKSVKSRPEADSYVQQGSFKVDVSRDLFLYTNTVRRARPKATTSSGGSSTHTSSSGRSHGGGGGKF